MVQQRFLVVDQLRRTGGRRGGREGSGQPARPERAQVQPDRRRTRPAVVEEGERPLRRRLCAGGIGDIEEGRGRLSGFQVRGGQVAAVGGVVELAAIEADARLHRGGALLRARQRRRGRARVEDRIGVAARQRRDRRRWCGDRRGRRGGCRAAAATAAARGNGGGEQNAGQLGQQAGAARLARVTLSGDNVLRENRRVWRRLCAD